MDTKTSSRIAILRFILIVGVVVLHTPPYVPITDVSSEVFSLIKSFFQNAFFRGSVPALTFISGYLLFRSNLDTSPLKLYAKKARALTIPFLFFNLSLFVLMSIAGMKIDGSLWNAMFSISGEPVNYPLSFLRDMMVLMLITPLLGLALRRGSLVSVIGLSVFFMGNYDGTLILRNEMPIIFFIGGMAAYHNVRMDIADKFALPCLALFVGLCIAVLYFKMPNTNILRYAAPFLLWPAASLLHNTFVGRACERLSKYSFFIFCAHAPVLAATWMLYEKEFQSVPYALYWVCTPAITVALLIAAYKAAMRLCGPLFRFVMGMPSAHRKLLAEPLPEKA